MNVQSTITIEVMIDDDDAIRASVTMRPMVPALSLAGFLEAIAHEIKNGRIDAIAIKEV